MGQADDAIVTSERFMHFVEKRSKKIRGPISMRNNMAIQVHQTNNTSLFRANRKQIIVNELGGGGKLCVLLHLGFHKQIQLNLQYFKGFRLVD